VHIDPDQTIVREPTSDVEYAAYFVAIQVGGVERILRRHYPMPNRLCAGCLATPTKYPCQAARIAEMAKQHAEYCGTPTPAAQIFPQTPTLPERPIPVRRKSNRKRRR
jgi:hypothetical protein